MSYHVLVIDDCDSFLRACRRQLSRVGMYEVATASTVSAAENYLVTSSPDVMLLDITTVQNSFSAEMRK